MAGEYSVDLGDLEILVSRLTAYQGFLTEQLDELQRRVAALSSNWSGAAAAAFEDAHREWSVGVAGVSAAVETMRRDAEQAHSSYTRVGVVNKKMVGRAR